MIPNSSPPVKDSATVRFSQDRSYSLVHSFLYLPRTDCGAGGSERDGADVGTMYVLQLPSLGGTSERIWRDSI